MTIENQNLIGSLPSDLRTLIDEASLLEIVLESVADPRDAVDRLAGVFGTHRLLWGSDFAQTHDRPYAELVEWGRSGASRLDDAGRAAFLGGTALRYWPELAA